MSKTNSVGKAIHEMHENLVHLTEQHNENSWMQNGKERLNDILRGEKKRMRSGTKSLLFSPIFWAVNLERSIFQNLKLPYHWFIHQALQGKCLPSSKKIVHLLEKR